MKFEDAITQTLEGFFDRAIERRFFRNDERRLSPKPHTQIFSRRETFSHTTTSRVPPLSLGMSFAEAEEDYPDSELPGDYAYAATTETRTQAVYHHSMVAVSTPGIGSGGYSNGSGSGYSGGLRSTTPNPGAKQAHVE